MCVCVCVCVCVCACVRACVRAYVYIYIYIYIYTRTKARKHTKRVNTFVMNSYSDRFNRCFVIAKCLTLTFFWCMSWDDL